jgi:hypothetical protein
VGSSFRQAGYGYTTDGGLSWTFPGVINPGVFRSDPVLDFDTLGNFYYNSLTSINNTFTCKVFKSTDGGATWNAGVNAKGGDKQWMTIDKSGGTGTGNIYSFWTSYYSSCQPGFFTRSANGGASFENCIYVEGNPYWGTMTVGPEGQLYIGASAGYSGGFVVARSTNAQTPLSTIVWDLTSYVDVDGYVTSQVPVNPVGLLGQVYIDVDRSDGPGHGNVYLVASVVRDSNGDPADVMFVKSTDGGVNWSDPYRINNDVSNSNYQWFGTMSVAPNGRIDVVWLDTRNAIPGSYMSELFYCYSDDQGESWSINKKISGSFDPHLGWPQQQKMGDYFHMISGNDGAHLAWANTFNGEQDVYYSYILPQIVGTEDEPAPAEQISVTAFPNPFRDRTTIRYILARESQVRLEILNVYGQTVKIMAEKPQKAGVYVMEFADENLPSGYYFCRLQTGTETRVARLVKVK